MTIGVDFDNTLVNYDALFHRVALQAGLIPSELPGTKISVRDHLRRTGREKEWTELQGRVYGPLLEQAPPFAGALEFLRECRGRGWMVRLISHKTLYPQLGSPHDLHGAARAWLEAEGFLSRDGSVLNPADLFFEPTVEAKIARIEACGCAAFVDDLPEFLLHPDFPSRVRRVLFDPANLYDKTDGLERIDRWAEAGRLLWGGPGPQAAALIDGARKLLRAEGKVMAGEPRALPGGANNRAYAVSDDQGGRYFLKHFFHDPADSRDRFATERAFYAFAEAGGIESVPEVWGWDQANRLGLFELVEGRRLEAAEIGPTEVQGALDFMAALNRSRERKEAKALPDVSEACFSVREHLRMLARRLARLQGFPVTTEVDARAADFVREKLVPAGERVSRAILGETAAGRGPDEMVPMAERCISPSDFGFHNSLRRPDGGLVFFDFEYAGWDDPAKTICDFFCQPTVPVPPRFFADFAGGIAAILGLERQDEFLARCRALFPLYQLKWCCIMLNEFSTADCGRREFALGAPAEEKVKDRQLALAAAALTRVGFYCQ